MEHFLALPYVAACTLLQACCYWCTSMFTNTPDKTTAMGQIQNTNINKQTNPLTPPETLPCTCIPISQHSLIPLFARSSIVWLVFSAFLQSGPVNNRWCQGAAGVSVWQGISINTDFLSISVCTTLLTINYGCRNVCYLPTEVGACVCMCKQAMF